MNMKQQFNYIHFIDCNIDTKGAKYLSESLTINSTLVELNLGCDTLTLHTYEFKKKEKLKVNKQIL